MTDTVEEEFNALVDALNRSHYDKNESILILKEYANVLFQNNIGINQRYGVAMTTTDFIKRVKNHDWKFAHGFLGNWAKTHAEAQQNKVPLDPFDVDDIGC